MEGPHLAISAAVPAEGGAGNDAKVLGHAGQWLGEQVREAGTVVDPFIEVHALALETFAVPRRDHDLLISRCGIRTHLKPG